MFRYLMLMIILLSLAACHYSHPHPYIENPTPRNLTPGQKTLLAEISASGIQVIKQGMRFTFEIPNDTFFEEPTRELERDREIDIDRLASFIRDYQRFFNNITVTVTGHTDVVFNAPQRDKISRHYAEIIAHYFREDGIPSDIIRVRGVGAKQQIGDDEYPMGSSFNRRVEVVIE